MYTIIPRTLHSMEKCLCSFNLSHTHAISRVNIYFVMINQYYRIDAIWLRSIYFKKNSLPRIKCKGKSLVITKSGWDKEIITLTTPLMPWINVFSVFELQNKSAANYSSQDNKLIWSIQINLQLNDHTHFSETLHYTQSYTNYYILCS